MSQKRSDQERAEAYARVLLETARAEGRANQDLVQWNHAVKFSPEVLETLTTMRREEDSTLIEEVAKQYKEYLDSGDDTVSLTATTAVPMDDELRQKICETMERELGEPIYLVERVDPSIIGGIVIEVRGNRYDASVHAQLSDIRRSLSSVYIGSDEQ